MVWSAGAKDGGPSGAWLCSQVTRGRSQRGHGAGLKIRQYRFDSCRPHPMSLSSSPVRMAAPQAADTGSNPVRDT